MICVENLSKSFGAEDLFCDISFHFPRGERVAVVGPNGAGKTTFLNILCGIEECNHGRVTKPQNCVVGYLPQEPNQNPEKTVLRECQSALSDLWSLQNTIENLLKSIEKDHRDELLQKYEQAESSFRSRGGYELESLAASILTGLGFANEMLLANPKELSGGWRVRLELARLFIRQPDVLILDEPTNHLDLPSLLWVEDYLKNYKGTLIFVSHDKPLLQNLATMILYLAGGKIFSFSGTYELFLKDYQLREEQSDKQHSQLEKKKTQLQNFVDKYGAKATKAAQARSKEKMIAKLDHQQAGLFQSVNVGSIHFKFPPSSRANRIVLKMEDVSIGYKDSLLDSVNLTIERGQRIGVLGANGIGKSSFLKTIMGVIPSLKGKIEFGSKVKPAYFAQNQHDFFDPQLSVLQNLVKTTNLSEGQARSLLGSMQLSNDDVLKSFSVISGGEKTRVGLARIVSQEPNLLLLDEPTNHLDLASVDELMEALTAYDGTLIIVSHNRLVIDRLCDKILLLKDHKQEIYYRDQLKDYKELFNLKVEKTREKISHSDNAISYQEAKVIDRKKRTQKNRMNAIEKQVDSLQEKLKSIEELMNSTKDYHDLIELQKDQERIKKLVLDLEDEWLSM